ncbi:hypothetical protein AAFF_G00061480 [Aldrovandia affinis]|uniref:Uncharacterized protein n=1 Tax=Aldrovandia affinis TaxID=143900 RepID=A0AAD7S2B4_9TELE|nr:hypothetical protein AAFF_G00061480 [Aldrovandia affinis]
MGAKTVRANLLVNNGKQLARSLMVLAHCLAEFVNFFARSVSGVVALARWVALSAQYVVSVCDSAYRHLRWWDQRGGGGAALHICPGRNTNSG